VQHKFVTLLMLCTACRNEASEQFSRAKYAAAHLTEKGKPISDPAFDAVLQDLKTVDAQSPHFEEAKKLRFAIESGRQHVRTPLALAPKVGTRSPELEAQLAACARLAQLAGEDGGAPRALAALEACRQRTEKMERESSHTDEPD
jgi:hypothetical protein